MTTSPPGQAAAVGEVAHALNMLSELPSHFDDAALPLAVRTACLESYFMNLRLMFEFMMGSRDVRHIHRHDFLPGWESANREKRKILGQQYGFASEQVAHLAKKRTLGPDGSPITLPPIKMFMITLLVFDVMKEFVADLAEAGSPETATFNRIVCEAEGRFRWPEKAYR